MLAAPMDLLQKTTTSGGVKTPGRLIAQQLRETNDRVERSPELVAHAGQEPALGWVGPLCFGLRIAALPGALGDQGLELAGEQSLAAQELGGGDRPCRPCREASQQLQVRLAEWRGTLHAVEIQTADNDVLREHRDQDRLAHPPPLDVTFLVRRKVGRKVVRIDGYHKRPSLLDDGFPRPGGIERDRGTDKMPGVFPDPGVGMIGGYRLNGLAVRRQEHHGAEVARGTGNLLRDDAQEGV